MFAKHFTSLCRAFLMRNQAMRSMNPRMAPQVNNVAQLTVALAPAIHECASDIRPRQVGGDAVIESHA
jgi:deoxyribodipyrimidine photolyase-related protein